MGPKKIDRDSLQEALGISDERAEVIREKARQLLAGLKRGDEDAERLWSQFGVVMGPVFAKIDNRE